MGGSEGALLNLSEIVLRVLVKDNLSDRDQRIVAMGNNLGDVKDVELVVFALLLWDKLDIPGPRGEVALLNVLEEVISSIVLAGGSEFLGLFGREVLDTLVSLEVIFDIVDLSFFINPLVCVRAVAVHVSVAIGGSAIREQDGHLVESLRRKSPEVPDGVGISQVGLGVSLLGVKEVGELNRIFNEKDRSIVPDHIVIAFFSIELDGKTSRVTNGISRSELTSDGRESQE